MCYAIKIMRFGQVKRVAAPVGELAVLPRPAPFGKPFGDFLPVLLWVHVF